MCTDLCYFSGRYGEDFVAKRQEKLQRWSNRIARHPVLSRSEVVNHFFLCDDAGVSGLLRIREYWLSINF
jgi:hypothetical protein